MNAETFKTWFENALLTNISPNSIIVMDNASYHSIQLNRALTMNNRKGVKLQRLLENKIPEVSEEMTKAELMEYVKMYKPSPVTYEIDSIAASHCHRVITLPPYHCHFNLIELIWVQVK
ncbi:hypothetical protein C0J52_09473 [Blattella germanica]|nr:hypothetical protein C0J52_09473 [Blattella germanica]